jgi:hypothetical protein
VKDLELAEKTRFFATLKMTKTKFLEVFQQPARLSRMIGARHGGDGKYWRENRQRPTVPQIHDRLKSSK